MRFESGVLDLAGADDRVVLIACEKGFAASGGSQNEEGPAVFRLIGRGEPGGPAGELAIETRDHRGYARGAHALVEKGAGHRRQAGMNAGKIVWSGGGFKGIVDDEGFTRLMTDQELRCRDADDGARGIRDGEMAQGQSGHAAESDPCGLIDSDGNERCRHHLARCQTRERPDRDWPPPARRHVR